MKPEIFDERVCILGESPQASGVDSSEISWVDIMGSKVLTRNLNTGATSEFSTEENVGFAITRKSGGYILGTKSGPILRDPDGATSELFNLQEVDPQAIAHPIRWNDAKISPSGNLFLGTMTYEMLQGTATLYKYATLTSELSVAISNMTISNGMDWSDDGSTMYYIDSRKQSVSQYSVENDEITFQREVITIDPEDGAPDGMTMDSQGGIWVALWGGSEIRRYDSLNNFALTQTIKFPVPFVTSCAFAGPNLTSLIVTTATDGRGDLPPEAGMTFIVEAGVKGRKSRSINL